MNPTSQLQTTIGYLHDILGSPKVEFNLLLPNQDLREILGKAKPTLEDLPLSFEAVFMAINSQNNLTVELMHSLNEYQKDEFTRFMSTPKVLTAELEHISNTLGDYAFTMTDKFCNHSGIEDGGVIFTYFFYCALASGGLNASTVYDPDFDYSQIEDYIVDKFNSLTREAMEDFKNISRDAVWKQALLQATFKHHKNIKYQMDFIKFANKLRILSRSTFPEPRQNGEAKILNKENVLSAMLKAVGSSPALAPVLMDSSDGRYFGVINYKLRSDQHRCFILDTKTGEIETSPCSHSRKSASYVDEGFADKFADRPGYMKLGLFKPGEIEFVPVNFASDFGEVYPSNDTDIMVDNKLFEKLKNALIFINA